jgi:linoleoyl-CoA desaturase
MNLLAGQKTNLKKALFKIIVVKLLYFGGMLVLPLMLLDLPWGHVVLGFLLMHYISGLILALVFQAAHIVGGTSFFKVNDQSKLENGWAIHQMKTTANFGNGSAIFTWFVGGLNHQIEHHLFPTICHVHYGPLSKIVRETAADHDVVYNHHHSFYTALKSHFGIMRKLGSTKEAA